MGFHGLKSPNRIKRFRSSSGDKYIIVFGCVFLYMGERPGWGEHVLLYIISCWQGSISLDL